MTKNANIDKYKYSAYSIGFDSRGSFTHPSGGEGRNVIIFGADLSSSAHANNKTKNILVLGKDFVQGLEKTTIYAEKMYFTNFTVDNKTFSLSLNIYHMISMLIIGLFQMIKYSTFITI